MAKKILVPLDGSKNSLRALDFAISIARQSRAVLTGIFVLERTPEVDFRRIGSVEKSILKKMKKFMDKAKIRAAQHGIVFNDATTFGDPGYTIVKFSQGGRFQLIVMGSRGMGAIEEAFLGSVSNYVVHKSKIPVIIVK